MRIVIPSVHYADFLAVTLPAWRAFLPKADVLVVTAPEDADSARVAVHHGARVHVTDAWSRPAPTGNHRQGPVRFNKAAALDEAFGFTPGFQPRPGEKEHCLALDADVYPFGIWPVNQARRSDTLYGCARYRCETPAALWAHRSGATARADLRLILTRLRGESRVRTIPDRETAAAEVGAKCLGYFQLFRYRPGLHFGSYRTAGKYDLAFRRQFNRCVGLTSVYVLHLGAQSRKNWTGRVVPRWAA